MQDVSALRRSLGLTQRELAELVGAHPMTVSKWERGVLEPRPAQRVLLADFGRALESGRLPSGGVRDVEPADRLAVLLDAARGERVRTSDAGAISATNRLAGRVVSIQRGDVLAKVVLEVAPGVRIGSVITTDSLDRLGLEVGSRAEAIIKATEVMVGVRAEAAA